MKEKTIYARQVDPAIQKAPFENLSWLFEENEAAIFGNDDYLEHMPTFIEKAVDTFVSGAYKELQERIDDGERPEEILTEYFPRPNHAFYTAEESATLLVAIDNFMGECDESFLKILSIVDGQKWNRTTLRGCGQSEWNFLWYRANNCDTSRIREIETLYFNLGSEWIIDDGEFDPETDTPDEIQGVHYYFCEPFFRIAQLKKELAAGESSCEVVLYAHDGYTYVSNYKLL